MPAALASPRGRSAAAHVFGTVLLWSFVPVVVKQLQPYNLGISLGRFVFAVLALAGIQALRGRRLFAFQGSRGVLLLGGVAMAGNYCFFNVGLRYTTASAANLVVQVEVVALVLLARWVLGERWTRAKALGIVVCMSGVLLVAWDGRPLHTLLRAQDLPGNALVFLAGCCWGVYAVCQRLLARTNSTLESLTALFLVSMAVTAAVVAVLGTGGDRPMPAIILLWCAVLGVFGTAASYVLLSRGIALSDATTAAMMTTSLPLFTATEAHLVLGESVSRWTFLGGSIIVSGLLLVAHEEAPLLEDAPEG
ncbi:MAG TPA: DMT family transporter [Armatimonadota bacterium]|jgi:drug/metabolite transporter (DMT)-like permease